MAKEKYVQPATEELDERHKKAMIFAKALVQQTIHDPDGKTSRRPSRSYTVYTKAAIEGYLESPTASEKSLRDASIFLYQVNSRYRNLLKYYANVPCWNYTINAVNFNPEKVKIENFKKQYQKACNVIESMGVVSAMRRASLVALREGAYYGVVWGGDGNAFIMQKLNPDNCIIISILDGNVFQYAYDMSKVKEEDLPTYFPSQFTNMFNEYKRTGVKYQIVPPEISVCIKADPSIEEYSIPPFSGILPTLYYIKNMEDLTEAATELSNYKLIAGEIALDDEGIPIIDYDVAMDYYRHIAGNVGDRVGVAITPFKLTSYDFEQSGTTSQVDNISRANENFFAAAGTSALLHGMTHENSGVAKLAIKVDESIAFELMNQCEKVINRYLKTLSGTQKFKINFLDVSIFNRDEMLSKYKEAMNYGIGASQYIACLGISQYDILNQAYIENNVLDIQNVFKPMKTASTQSDSNSSGRPSSSDEDLGDEGENTRDSDANSNR